MPSEQNPDGMVCHRPDNTDIHSHENLGYLHVVLHIFVFEV